MYTNESCVGQMIWISDFNWKVTVICFNFYVLSPGLLLVQNFMGCGTPHRKGLKGNWILKSTLFEKIIESIENKFLKLFLSYGKSLSRKKSRKLQIFRLVLRLRLRLSAVCKWVRDVTPGEACHEIVVVCTSSTKCFVKMVFCMACNCSNDSRKTIKLIANTGLSVEAGNRRISAGCQAESSRLFFSRCYCDRMHPLLL